MIDFDDLCFGDEDKIEELESFREEIIDRYLKKELTATEAHDFETYFLASPHHQQKFEFSQKLMATVTASKSSFGSFKESFGQFSAKVTNFFSLNKLVRAGLVAAGLLTLVVFLGLIFFQSTRNNRAIVANPTNQSILKTPPVNNNSVNENVGTKPTPLENQQNLPANKPKNQTEKEKASPSENKQPDSPENNKPKVETHPIFGIFVLTGGARSEGTKNKLLKINRLTPKNIPFQIDSPEDSSKSYLVLIKTVENNEVWRSAPLKIKQNSKRLLLFVPQENLSDGDYKLEVFAANDLEFNITGYSFRVKKEN